MSLAENMFNVRGRVAVCVTNETRQLVDRLLLFDDGRWEVDEGKYKADQLDFGPRLYPIIARCVQLDKWDD